MRANPQPLLALWLLFGTSARAERPSDAVRDLDAVVDFVEAAHPDLYRYTTEAEWHQRIDAERADLAAHPEHLGRALHRVLAPIADGHLAVALPEFQPDAAPFSVLPLFAVRAGDRWLVDAAPGIEAGAEILSIDGKPIAQVVASLGALVLADGIDPEPRLAAIEADLPRLWTLEYGQAETFAIEIREQTGVRSAQVRGVPREGISALGLTRLSEFRPLDPQPSVESFDDGTAVLTLPAFGMADQTAYRALIDGLWPQIEASDRLILDLRGNPGGFRPNGFAVLDRLLDRPYPQWSAVHVGPIPKTKRPATAKPLVDGSEIPRAAFTLNQDPLEAQMHPTDTPYPGPVAVLVDGRTTSAANTFVLALERIRPETLVIGRRLGGACDRHSGELPVVFSPGRTDVHLLISIFAIDHLAPARCEPGRGLLPDLEVHASVEQRRQGIDPDLAAAVQALSALDDRGIDGNPSSRPQAARPSRLRTSRICPIYLTFWPTRPNQLEPRSPDCHLRRGHLGAGAGVVGEAPIPGQPGTDDEGERDPEGDPQGL